MAKGEATSTRNLSKYWQSWIWIHGFERELGGTLAARASTAPSRYDLSQRYGHLTSQSNLEPLIEI
jgi:hypothetical protein